jgi:Undecaprenyl-phosphate glucose phosphotransferase
VLKTHNQVLLGALRGLDVVLAFLAWEFAYRARFFWLNWPTADYIPDHVEYLKAAFAAALLTALTFSLANVYRTQSFIRPRQDFLYLLRGGLYLFLTLIGVAFYYREFSYSRVHTLYFLVFLLLLLVLSRYLARKSMKWLHRHGYHLRKIAVIGSGETALNFAQRLAGYQRTGILLKGVLSLQSGTSLPTSLPQFNDLEELVQRIQRQEIDQVFLALSPTEQTYLPQLKEQFAELWVDLHIVPNLGSFRTLHTETENFEGMPVVTIVRSPLFGWNRLLKRGLDMVGAAAALLIFGPIMLLIAGLVRLSSAGPIFYRQERMGLDGRTFNALKFRSMRLDAEQRTGAVWASKDDDRCTPIGRFIRKVSLDELPQLFNVLRGEMSLVGPRPERPVFIEQFKKQIPDYMLRHKVKAGITGWAQINGWRGNTSLEKRIEFDLYYIERWSLWFDIKILFLTIFRGFVDPNAY